jgi:hypothetical protein
MGHKHEDLECRHICYYMGELIREMEIRQIHDLEGMQIVILVNDRYTTSIGISTILKMV